MAEQVMQMPVQLSAATALGETVQRAPSPVPGGGAPAASSGLPDLGPGRPLDAATRAFFGATHWVSTIGLSAYNASVHGTNRYSRTVGLRKEPGLPELGPGPELHRGGHDAGGRTAHRSRSVSREAALSIAAE